MRGRPPSSGPGPNLSFKVVFIIQRGGTLPCARLMTCERAVRSARAAHIARRRREPVSSTRRSVNHIADERLVALMVPLICSDDDARRAHEDDASRRGPLPWQMSGICIEPL